MSKYTVTRDCCYTGNCDRCSATAGTPTPYGKPARVIHIETDDRATAEQVVKNWRDFDARIEHAVGV